jgi:Na+/pantothenate symporter
LILVILVESLKTVASSIILVTILACSMNTINENYHQLVCTHVMPSSWWVVQWGKDTFTIYILSLWRKSILGYLLLLLQNTQQMLLSIIFLIMLHLCTY